MFKKYFKPKSVTWWSGVATIAYGIYNKDIQAIIIGLGAIGLRGAVK